AVAEERDDRERDAEPHEAARRELEVLLLELTFDRLVEKRRPDPTRLGNFAYARRETVSEAAHSPSEDSGCILRSVSCPIHTGLTRSSPRSRIAARSRARTARTRWTCGRTAQSSTPRRGAACSARPRSSASCRCTSRAASRSH